MPDIFHKTRVDVFPFHTKSTDDMKNEDIGTMSDRVQNVYIL